jgi:leucyl-tRNA synthetase
MARGVSRDDAQAAAMADENVGRFLADAAVRNVIFVPDRLINIVVA